MTQAIRVRGLREFQRDIRHAEKDTRKEVRDGLKKAGEPVRREWAETFARVDAHSASKLRVRVGVSGVWVDQPLRKTTGQHPEFGLLQQAHGERALDRKASDVERELAKAVDDLADTAEGKL